MSSIYRKGRDGYYYYQTYVYDPNSGKKDKRIFHSLGTKDEAKAKIKQVELDKNYELKRLNFGLRKTNNYKSIFFYSAAFGLFCILMISFFNELKTNQKNIDSFSIKEDYVDTLNVALRTAPQKDDSLINSKILIEQLSSEIEKFKTTPKKESYLVDTINYSIERVENLSDVFNQGKIYITMSKNSSSNEILAICQKIKNDLNEFSNLIICVFANSNIDIEDGYKRAEKNKFFHEKQTWLAMYTFNPIEGEFFDDKPRQSLGAY